MAAPAARRSAQARAAGRESVDPGELEKFARLAETWWDPEGEMKPLHAMAPVRIGYLRDRLAAHFGREAGGMRPLAGLRVLDVGCGGGLVAEPLARLGARVVGIDAAREAVTAAAVHARESGLAIDYRVATAEDLARKGMRFDAVLALEIVEHVARPAGFLGACSGLVRPGGAFVLSTLNRTPKAFLLGIVGVEYVLGWLPRGTHDWRKFLSPSEVSAMLRRHGLATREVAGVVYDPLAGGWRLSERDLAVNYMLFAAKP